VLATISFILRQAEETAEEGNDPAHLYPHWEELVVGALAFAVLFFFVWKWVLPRLRQLLDERREKIQGELERAEETRQTAERELAEYRERLAASREEANQIIEEARRAAEQVRAELQKLQEEYRQQLAGAREESNRIIEEARATAEQLRKDIQAKAEEESQATVARAQEEIRAERDRVFQELRGEVAEIAVGLAGRVVGESLDKGTHQRLIDEYIDQVASSGNGKH
jgi:F-type H+-transporting ATPase subunit b